MFKVRSNRFNKIVCTFNPGGRMVVTYSTGELHIRNARVEDGLARYSCMTLHSLTQERKRSAPAVLTVTGQFCSVL